ncbi:MAG: hypothetical protein LBK06_09285 [Planctomycetaceae bacterium]|jgi:hypothetical protein|nr:hypothetical protein [Planctomycetaceae bacterium]
MVEIGFTNDYTLYTEAGKAIGFALEQSLHVVALPCSALRILKRLQHTFGNFQYTHHVPKVPFVPHVPKN